MNNDLIKILNILTDLAQLDIDAVYAYEQAIEQINEVEVRENIMSFRDDHNRHIDELGDMIVKKGGLVPERKRDFKGFVIEGFTALRSMTGTYGALRAMEINEKTTNRNYKSALDENPDLPEDVIALLEKNYSDERRHLAYIQNTVLKLKQKV